MPDEDDEEGTADEHDAPLKKEMRGAVGRWPGLDHCVEQVISMMHRAREVALTSGEDESVIEEYWIQSIDQDHLDALTEDILGEVERRLCTATGRPSWPVMHQIPDTFDRVRFFRQLRPFYHNHRNLFGALVTPLVQGIRVRGRFFPPAWVGLQSAGWVLLDGQGVGHEQGTATKINQTLPPELTKKFSEADLICLVDKSMPAMIGDAPIILQDLITADSDEVARAFRDDVARCSDMMSPGSVPLLAR